MAKLFLAATTALTLISGFAWQSSSSTSSTTVLTPGTPPAHDVDVDINH